MNPFEPPKSEEWPVMNMPARGRADADNVAQLASTLILAALLVTTFCAVVFTLYSAIL